MTKPKKNPLEWAVFAFSAILIVAAVALLIVSAIKGRATPPELRVELGSAERSGAGFRMPVRIRNEGGTTAERVRIETALERGGAELERTELLIEFVPAGSERHGWVVFRHDPSCCRASARAVAFEAP